MAIKEQDYFITSWQIKGRSKAITIPVNDNFTYNYSVDWGDGTTDSGLTSSVTHVYDAEGTFDVKIYGEFPAVEMGRSAGNRFKIQSIKQWGTIVWKTFEKAFAKCSNLDVKATDLPNLSQVTSMSSMFNGCSYLVGNKSFISWNVSSVTDTSKMFFNCHIFNENIDKWNTTNIANMSDMFVNCRTFNQSLDDWDVGNVTNMSSMFSGCTSFNQSLNDWDVSNVTSMGSMFSYCISFNQSLDDWNVSNVTNMSSMFRGCTSFNQSFDNWGVSNVTNMSSMFSGCTSFNQLLDDWDVSKVANMRNMFASCIKFNQPLGSWDVSSVTNMDTMFYDCADFNQKLDTWDVGNVVSMNRMFAGCRSFDQPLGSWNVSNVGDMYTMFSVSSLSTNNYDNLLIGWSQLQLKQNVAFSLVSTYCKGRRARQYIIDTFGWRLTDGGKDKACTNVSLSQSTITASPKTIEANGTEQAIITVQLKDAAGNDIVSEGETVVIATNNGNLTATIDNGDGTYTAVLSTTITGSAILSFTVNGNAASNTTGVKFKELDGCKIYHNDFKTDQDIIRNWEFSAISWVVDVEDGVLKMNSLEGNRYAKFFVNIPEGVKNLEFESRLRVYNKNEHSVISSPIIMQVRALDTEGNQLGYKNTTIQVTNLKYGVPFETVYKEAYALPEGTSKILFRIIGGHIYFRTDLFYLTITDLDCNNTDFSLKESTITASPNTIIADGFTSSTITVTLKDDDGNILTSSTNEVVISTDIGTISNTINNNDGTYTAILTSNEVGTAEISFSVDGELSPNTAQVVLVPFKILITDTTLIQSPSFYLQSAGSLGTDGTPRGIYSRWIFNGDLGENHLPKGNLARTAHNYNKQNDFVKLYRAPYQKVSRTLRFSSAPITVNNSGALWVYELDGKRFTVTFTNKIKYAEVRTSINPLEDPLSFIASYGNEVIEIESKRDLFFALEIDATNISANSSLFIETQSVAQNSLLALKKVTNRKTIRGNSILNYREVCDNGRVFRFKPENHQVTAIRIELYEDFINKINDANLWTKIGEYALTDEDEAAFQRLEPESNVVHGSWPKFNDGAKVNIHNYKQKWNGPGEGLYDRNLKEVIKKYVELSDFANNPRALETFTLESAVEPITEDDSIELSNLDMLKLAAYDFHMARMLGLGTLDLNEVTLTGSYMYIAEYISFEKVKSGDGTTLSETKHLALSLPTALEDERLPVPLELDMIKTGVESESSIDLADEDGYTHDGKKRYITLSLKDIQEEGFNLPFFANSAVLDSSNNTFPIYVGVEHRNISIGDSDDGIWNKPELSHDVRYLNIDATANTDFEKYEPSPIVIPENGNDLLVHKQTEEGEHFYGSYSINWFSRTTSGAEEPSIITSFNPPNVLLPPSNIQVQLIQSEEPVLLTSQDEQFRLSRINDSDKTLARVTFDYHTYQELLEYQVTDDYNFTDDQLINNPDTIFADSKEVFAEEVELFFRNELPQNVSGKIVKIENDPENILLSILEVAEYDLASIGTVLSPAIEQGTEDNFVGGVLVIEREQFIIHEVIQTPTFPKFKVYKKEVSEGLTSNNSNQSIDADNLQAPELTNDGLFMAIENMLNVSSWNRPNPQTTKIKLGSSAIKRELIEKIVDGESQKFLQKSRGIWSKPEANNTTITKIEEPIDTNGNTAFKGLYKIVFNGVKLHQHEQYSLDSNSVEWYQGIVRVPMVRDPRGNRRSLKVLKIKNIIDENTLPEDIKDIELIVLDPSYSEDNYDKEILDGNNVSVNFYPGYRCYFYKDDSHNFNAVNILPTEDSEEDTRNTIIGLRSYDNDYNYWSKISVPSQLIAQRIIEPKQPEKPLGALYATRPDYFGRSTYSIRTQYKHKPHGVLFYRANDEALLNAIYEQNTILKIRQELQDKFGENDVFFANRWKNFINFSELKDLGDFKLLPEEEGVGYKFPNPDKKVLFERANEMIKKINNDPITPPDTPFALFNTDEADQDYEVGKLPVGDPRLIGFARDAILSSFVPLTEVPIVYNYIKRDAYIPVNKKQVIRDKDGMVLKPNSPEFDMAPMMRRTANPNYETEFIDFHLDGTSKNIYFYGVRELSSRMKLGEFSPFLGPVKLVNTNPPEAPEIKRIIPVLENSVLGISPKIQLEINAYPSIQNIKKVTIYRAFNKADALSVRTMTKVKEVDLESEGIINDAIWKVSDEFIDLKEAPFGDGIFYRATVSREVEYENKNNEVVLEYQPSQPSKIIASLIVDVVEPLAPTPSFSSDPIQEFDTELTNVTLLWDKTCYNGKYHVYKMNQQGNWVKISMISGKNESFELELSDITLDTNTLNSLNLSESGSVKLLNDSEEVIYHHFKIIAENTSGMFSKKEKILTILRDYNKPDGINFMIVEDTFIIQ